MIELPRHLRDGDQAAHSPAELSPILHRWLTGGQEAHARELVCRLHAAGFKLSMLCDQLIGPAAGPFDIGPSGAARNRVHVNGNGQAAPSHNGSTSGDRPHAYQARLAVEITRRILFELADRLPPLSRGAPRAIGCAPSAGRAQLPTLMAQLVLREAGWQAQSLGADFPLDLLVPALAEEDFRLCWISASGIRPSAQLRTECARLAQLMQRRDGLVVIHAAAADDLPRAPLPATESSLDFATLARLARGQLN